MSDDESEECREQWIAIIAMLKFMLTTDSRIIVDTVERNFIHDYIQRAILTRGDIKKMFSAR